MKVLALVAYFVVTLQMGSGRAAANELDSQSRIENRLVYLLRPVHSYLCLDVWYESLADNAHVVQHNCHFGLNQQWDLENMGNQQYRIRAAHSGKCLDVAAAGDVGTPIVQRTCDNGPSQMWSLEHTNELAFALKSISAERCLDVEHSSLESPARVLIYPCHYGPNQQWVFDSVPQ